MSNSTKIKDLPRQTVSDKSEYTDLLDRAHAVGLDENATEKEVVNAEKNPRPVSRNTDSDVANKKELGEAIDQLNKVVDNSDPKNEIAIATKRVNEAFRSLR